MSAVAIVILVALVLSAVLLVLLVLIQDESGEGVGGIFGGGSTTPFGSRAGNVLTRLTAALAAVFLVCAFVLAWLNRTPETGNVIGKARQQQLEKPATEDWWVQTPAPAAEQAPAPDTQTPAGGQ